jgi:hypothetical protein
MHTITPDTALTAAAFIGASSYFSAAAVVYGGPIIRAAARAAAHRTPVIRHRKVGGITFVRVGRFQFSFCKCRL